MADRDKVENRVAESRVQPMNPERLIDLYDRVADAPDAVERLRKFVLDLAVRGALVEQDPADESADSLVERIATTRERQSKKGLIKKPKPSAPIDHHELPIEIPSHWAWLRLNDIGTLAGGMTPSKNQPDYWDGDVVWLSPKDIKVDEANDSELKITSKGLSETRLQLYPPGSLFMVARSGILKRTFPVAINRVHAACNQDIKVLVPFLEGQEKYLQIMFRGLTDFILSSLVKTGTTVQSLKYSEFATQPFPIPPLGEQHRIVAKVNELMALLDRLETTRTRRETTRNRLTTASLTRLTAPEATEADFPSHARFALDNLDQLTSRPEQIKVLRQTILNLAVRGRLVEQDAGDEPASDLLKHIDEQRSIERRRRGLFDPITDDEQPFAPPEGWKWARFGEVFSIRTGFAFKSSSYEDHGLLVFRVVNFNRHGSFDLSDTKFFPKRLVDKKIEGFLLEEGEILMVMVGGTIGKTTRVTKEILPALLNQNMWRIRSYGKLMSNDYEYLLIRTVNQEIENLTASTHGHFSMSDYEQKPICIPPLAEQDRIVARVDGLMHLCGRLETTLSNTETTRARLFQNLIHVALPSAHQI